MMRAMKPTYYLLGLVVMLRGSSFLKGLITSFVVGATVVVTGIPHFHATSMQINNNKYQKIYKRVMQK